MGLDERPKSVCECSCIGGALSNLLEATVADRQAFPMHYSQDDFPLQNTTSDTLVRKWQPCPQRECDLVGFISSHHEEVALVTTVALSATSATPHGGERSAPHWQLSRPCRQAAEPGHRAAHSPGNARPVKDPPGIFRARHQPPALLDSPAQAGRQTVEPPTKHFNRIEGKPHSCSKEIERAFNRQFTACSVPQDWTLGSVTREIHTTIAWIPHTGRSTREASLR